MALVLWIGCASARADVIVQSVAIGFKARKLGESYAQGVMREGSWIPVVVDLVIENQAAFDGSLRIAQFDSDGDVAYDRVPVHLLASTGGAQRYVLYMLPSGQAGDRKLQIDVLDEQGRAVPVIYAGIATRTVRVEDTPATLEESALLLVDISVGAGARVSDLSDTDMREFFEGDVLTARLSAGDLPEHWVGLEAVDIVVWDEADPADFKTEAQLRALVDWVRHGGTLVIAASRTAASLASSDILSPILPVQIGQVRQTPHLGGLPQRLLGMSRMAPAPSSDGPAAPRSSPAPNPLIEPANVVPCDIKDRSRTLSFNEDPDAPELSGLVTRWPVGRGAVVFCGVTLHDLFTKVGGDETRAERGLDGKPVQPSRPVEFFKRVLFLRRGEHSDIGWDHEPLFAQIQTPINFSANSGLFMIFSFAFIGAYATLATVASWWFLRRRGWERHSWSLFAVVAVAASVLSVVVVQSVRGFGQTIEQLSVVDLRAGESQGCGSFFAGVRTGTHTSLDLWLPRDYQMDAQPGATACFLRPAPRSSSVRGGTSSNTTTFTDPGRYTLIPAGAMVSEVPMRATLKKFDGRWQGHVEGTVEGHLAVLPVSDRREKLSLFTANSSIVNKLPCDLTHCYLLYADKDYVLPNGSHLDDVGQRADYLFAIPLGDIKSQATLPLGDLENLAERSATGSTPPDEVLRKYRLVEEQKRWQKPMRTLIGSLASQSPAGPYDMRLEPFQSALLLASTLTELAHPQKANAMEMPMLFSRDHLRELDLHGVLRPDAAVLIGFARDPGPIRLASRPGGSEREFHVITPDRDQSWTMYRIVIPVRR